MILSVKYIHRSEGMGIKIKVIAAIDEFVITPPVNPPIVSRNTI